MLSHFTYIGVLRSYQWTRRVLGVRTFMQTLAKRRDIPREVRVAL